MHRLLSYLLFLIWLPAAALTTKDIDNVHVADRTRFVSDMAGAMSAPARARADSLLQSIWRQTSAEPVVVIVPSLDGEDIDDFATELFSDWGIGKDDRDNGVLMLISIGDRKAVIRTGYGTEGILPDVVCGRIIRNEMAPRFREDDYDGGILASLQTMQAAMTSDEARAELMSDKANDATADEFDADEAFDIYWKICVALGMLGLLAVIIAYLGVRRLPTSRAYATFENTRLGLLVASFLSLGCLFPAYFLMLAFQRHIRLHKRLCPNCNTRMLRVDEDNDNAYLTASQDAEERLDSVDYDVWLCPDCGETDIIPYVNPKKNYTECPSCHARACTLVNRRTVLAPTTRREGRGIEEYVCLNCRRRYEKPYTIAKEVEAPIIIGGGGFGSGGGGGFSGGSFGGGMTGGGGASGGW